MYQAKSFLISSLLKNLYFSFIHSYYTTAILHGEAQPEPNFKNK